MAFTQMLCPAVVLIITKPVIISNNLSLPDLFM